DDLDWLASLLRLLHELSQELPVLFPMHPRTRQRLWDLGLVSGTGNHRLQLLDPAPYLSFLGMQSRATVVITDSGGIQEETTYLRVPCLTVRENTERPITVSAGTNVLVGRDPQRIHEEVERILAGNSKQGSVPALWDGHAAQRIASVI